MRDVSRMPRYSKFEKQIRIEKHDVRRKTLLCVSYDCRHMSRHKGEPSRLVDQPKTEEACTEPRSSLRRWRADFSRIAGFAMSIQRNHIQKCFKRELESSQIMNVQSGFYSQIGNLSTVPMWQTAHLSKHSRLSNSALISHAAKNVSILKHPASFTYDQYPGH